MRGSGAQIRAGAKSRPLAKTQSESSIQRAVIAAWRANPAPNTLLVHVPNGGYRSPIEAKIMKGQGVTPGVPDLMYFSAYGNVRFLELKSAKGRLSPAQIDMHASLAAMGHEVRVAHSVDEALAILQDWGAFRRKFHS